MFPHTALPLLSLHEQATRKASPLSTGERELIAAYVSGLNACDYCHGVHSETAARFKVMNRIVVGLGIRADATYFAFSGKRLSENVYEGLASALGID